MRQAQIPHFGGPDDITIVDDAPIPSPGPGEVVVKVIGAGANPIDYKIRDGSSRQCERITDADFPLVLGRECCGEITAVGEDVLSLHVGQTVFGMLPMERVQGTYAEYVAMPAGCVIPAPEGVDPIKLAGASLVGLTGWLAANDLARVRYPDVVLVQGGSGGVGQVAIQFCVAAGADVFATASPANRDRIEALGARFIDYTTQNWTTIVDSPDVIIDCVYHGTFEAELDHLKPGGRLVVLPSLADLTPARQRGINASIPAVYPSRQRLSQLATALERGDVDIEVTHILSLDRAAEAHRMLETGHTRGKIVLVP